MHLGEYGVRALIIQELVQQCPVSKAQIHWQLFFLSANGCLQENKGILDVERGSLFLHCGWEHKLRSSGVPSTTSIIDD